MTHPPTADEPQIIAPELAREAINAEILRYLGTDWARTWIVAHESDYLVRLNKGNINIDFQADLLGNVEITEQEANPLQVSGWLIVFMVLLAFLLVALTISAMAGV